VLIYLYFTESCFICSVWPERQLCNLCNDAWN